RSGAALLLLLLSVLSGCQAEKLIEVLSGRNVSFKAEASAPPTEINWYKDESKVVDVEDGTPPYYYKLRNRVLVDLVNRTFILINVTLNDNGRYRAAALVNSNFENSYNRLQVIDPVCEVVIHSIIHENHVMLHCNCTNHGAPPAKYEWYNGSDPLVSQEQSITVLRKGKPQLFKCVASNEVSNNMATFLVLPKDVPGIGVHQSGHDLLLLSLVILRSGSGILNRASCERSLKHLTTVCSVFPTEDKQRKHFIIAIVLLLVFATALLIGIFLCKQKTRNMNAEIIVPAALFLIVLHFPLSSGSSNVCARVNLRVDDKRALEIFINKAKKLLMKIELQSQLLDIKRLIVQKGSLKITQVEASDYGTYTAEVQPCRVQRESFTFRACELAQNGEAGAHDDQSQRGALLVYPQNGVLNMQVRDTECAAKIIWKKDNGKFLTVTCDSDSLVKTMALSEGALSMDLISGDKERYHIDVALRDGNLSCYTFDVNGAVSYMYIFRILLTSVISLRPDAAVHLEDLTLCPVNVKEAKKIIWKKDNKTIVEWEAAAEKLQYSKEMEVILNSSSGDLKLQNVQEKDNGKYVIEATSDETTVQTFCVTI
ncbi:hypothetical protein PRIEUP_LOCUS12021, partial [Pristimantis euphronides]